MISNSIESNSTSSEGALPLHQFTLMGLSPCTVQSQSQDCDSETNTIATSYRSSVSTSSQLSGWGSAMSRKSYACLRTLEEECRRIPQRPPTAHKRRRVSSTKTSSSCPSWGYFVDTPDC
mmetsp:Transcript_16680/g.19028  ORF Transcript_16680/g.19028 Transcript_16680/m.19028 type:complete len:120 (+) Transcript_16680:173-532(+)